MKIEWNKNSFDGDAFLLKIEAGEVSIQVEMTEAELEDLSDQTLLAAAEMGHWFRLNQPTDYEAIIKARTDRQGPRDKKIQREMKRLLEAIEAEKAQAIVEEMAKANGKKGS